jgi:Zn-finger protein
MKKCTKCGKENLQIYFEKEDGDVFVRYVRCPDCTETYEIKIRPDSSKYFRNLKCEFWPCHDREDQNCLWCYCPLYCIAECEGSCSNCYYPHEYKNYDKIISRLKEEYGPKKLTEEERTEQCNKDNESTEKKEVI